MNILSQKQMFLSHEFDFFRLLIPCIFLHFLNNQTNKKKPNQREKVTWEEIKTEGAHTYWFGDYFFLSN